MSERSGSDASGTVVVVDDETTIRELLTESVEAWGYPVRSATNAAEAFEHVRAGGVHLVLSDLDMPGENGFELLGRIKGHEPDVEVIMVTGVVDLDMAIRAIRRGAADYVTKPFNLEEVRIVLERTLDKRRLVLENREYQLQLESKVEARTREVVEKGREIEALYRDLRESYEVTLEALVNALDFRDNETHGHSRRVVDYAVVVASSMGVGEPDLTWIRQGAILHDVGKIGVPDSILRKPGKLDPDERREMEKHPEMGFRMLRHIKFLARALDIVHCHQERWDGSGYPRGLKGDEIPLGARIFAVVDTFDAMTSDRPYRAALSIDSAREEIRRYAGIQFDPAASAAFLRIEPEVWGQIRERVHEEIRAIDEARRFLRS